MFRTKFMLHCAAAGKADMMSLFLCVMSMKEWNGHFDLANSGQPMLW